MTLQLFKWLMSLVLVTFMPVLLQGCKQGYKTVSDDDEYDDAHTTDFIEDRVNEIYSDVTAWYNTVDSIYSNGLEMPNGMGERHFEKDFCSEDWNNTMEAVRELDGEGLGIEMDHWIGAQDFEHVSISGLNIDYDEDEQEDTATATFDLHNGDKPAIPYKLLLVYENDNWYIDEMSINWNSPDAVPYLHVKADMKRYLKMREQTTEQTPEQTSIRSTSAEMDEPKWLRVDYDGKGRTVLMRLENDHPNAIIAAVESANAFVNLMTDLGDDYSTYFDNGDFLRDGSAIELKAEDVDHDGTKEFTVSLTSPEGRTASFTYRLVDSTDGGEELQLMQ